MAGHNPYAPSAATLKPAVAVSGVDGDIRVWREGQQVVMLPESSLGDRCVKCNEPAHEPSKLRTLYYHNPWLYLLIVSPIIYIIVALIVRKKAVVDPGLCASHKRARRNHILAAWGLLLAAIALPILLPLGGAGILVAMACVGVALYLGFSKSRLLYVKKIDKFEVRLAGAGEDFLDSLPDHAQARRGLLAR